MNISLGLLENELFFFIFCRRLLCAFVFFISIYTFGQIQTPQTPSFGTFKPISPSQSYQPQNNNYNKQSQSQNNKSNIYEQDRIKKQQQKQELDEVLTEVHSYSSNSYAEYWKAPNFSQQTKSYYTAYNKLKDMLTGKATLSVKDAYYEIENAYGNVFLTKKEFDDEVKKSTDFIKQWLFENGYDLKNNIALHYGIQKFMTDTLTIGNKIKPEVQNMKPTTHLGFYYDYQDYKAERDYRSYHATKTFATGNGQCHTLPIVYAIISESLGAKFYLSYAPIHDFIKYPDNNGNIHNFEATSNWQISDQWYKDNLFVTSLAEKNQIYLNRMDRKQIVAGALIDLACSYKQKFGIADGEFISQCVDFAMNYFPNKEANIYGWFLRGQIATIKINRVAKKNGLKTAAQAKKNPEANLLLNQLDSINAKIESLGYEDIPESAYDEMVQNQDSKGNIQKLKQFNNLKKRNLFINLNTK